MVTNAPSSTFPSRAGLRLHLMSLPQLHSASVCAWQGSADRDPMTGLSGAVAADAKVTMEAN